MAKAVRSYKVKDLDLNIEDTTEEEKEEPPKPDYLSNILIIALVFETILLITFAKGDARAVAVPPTPQVAGDQVCGTTRTEVMRILIRQRNIALRTAQAERGNFNERAWSLVADVLDQIRDQVDDRLKPLTWGR